MRKVALILGSDSDIPVAREAVSVLDSLGIESVARILSAHRTPDALGEFVRRAQADGFGVIIAAAGKAAHLAGAVAAQTVLPVIGVPLKSGELDGLDALLSTVQMPSGVPVATVAINGAKNAAYLAAQILALGDEALNGRLIARRDKMRRECEAKDARAAEKIRE